MNNDERAKEKAISSIFRAGLIVESGLLKKIDGSYILENMLKNNTEIKECIFNQRESLRLILEYKRYDLLKYVTIRNLLRKKNNRETYLEYILRQSKTNPDINVSLFDPFCGAYSYKNIADFYITYAKYGLEDHLPMLTDEILTSRESNPILRALTFNKTFLSLLLRRKKNRELVKTRLISKGLIRNMDIIMALKETEDYKVPLDIQDSYAKLYIEEENDTLESIYSYLRPREKELIAELVSVMDGRCDEVAMNTVVYSYIEQIYYGKKEEIYAEIRRLIDIFKIDKSFKIEMGNDSQFSPIENKITLNSMSTSVLNHELGHMFFAKLTTHKVDEEFYDIVNNIKGNPETLIKLDMMSKKYQAIKDAVKKRALEYYEIESADEFTMGELQNIEKSLKEEKEEKLDFYRKKGYSKKVLETVLDRSYTIEEYMEQHKKVQTRALRETIRREKLSPYSAIADIIDAIYLGEFYSGKLKNTKGEDIKPMSGHGIFYYNMSKSIIFDEIFAQYCTLRKNHEIGISCYMDPRGESTASAIDCLRDMIGNELVDYLEKFYQEQILDSEKYVVSRSR